MSSILEQPTNEDEDAFWLRVSEHALAAVWDNPEDDVYAELAFV